MSFPRNRQLAQDWRDAVVCRTVGRGMALFLEPFVGPRYFRGTCHDAQILLSRPRLGPPYHTGTHNLVLTAGHMRSLPQLFIDSRDPLPTQGRRHRHATVLAIAAGAVLYEG